MNIALPVLKLNRPRVVVAMLFNDHIGFQMNVYNSIRKTIQYCGCHVGCAFSLVRQYHFVETCDYYASSLCR